MRGWYGTICMYVHNEISLPPSLSPLQLAILIFVENQLALILVNKPENKLRKPVGYHVDLALVGILSGVCGLVGIPFLCGAPVRSIQHLQALSVFEKKHAPGEKPRLVKIHEQRVTIIVVHALISECWLCCVCVCVM